MKENRAKILSGRQSATEKLEQSARRRPPGGLAATPRTAGQRGPRRRDERGGSGRRRRGRGPRDGAPRRRYAGTSSFRGVVGDRRNFEDAELLYVKSVKCAENDWGQKYVRRVDSSPVHRGAATWIFRGGGSRRRRGCHVDSPRGREADEGMLEKKVDG